MSHITTAEGVDIKDLGCLEKAAEACGCELQIGTEDKMGLIFKTYGGQKASCHHKIKRKGCTYEIGVNRNADGTYKLSVDNWGDMGGLKPHVGHDAGKLLQNYSAFVTKKQLKKQGWRVKEKTTENGCIKLTATR